MTVLFRFMVLLLWLTCLLGVERRLLHCTNHTGGRTNMSGMLRRWVYRPLVSSRDGDTGYGAKAGTLYAAGLTIPTGLPSSTAQILVQARLSARPPQRARDPTPSRLCSCCDS